MDACVATARPPSTFVLPSFSQSRGDKAQRSAGLLITPQAVSSTLMTSCFVGNEPVTPKSAVYPPGASTSSLLASSSSSSEAELPANAFVTPPQGSRLLSQAETSNARNVLNPLRLPSEPSSSSAAMKKNAGLFIDSTRLPMTPPLTPPYPNHAALLPALGDPLPSSPSPASAPAPKAAPSTVSGRALAHHTLHPLFASTYTLCEELGSGGFGFVVRAERNIDGLGVAVKFIERAKIPSHGWVKSRSWGETPGLTQPPGPKLVPMEAFVLRSVRHEGVVAFIDLFEDEKYFYLIMEHHGTPWEQPERAPPAAAFGYPSSPTSAAMSPMLTSCWPRPILTSSPVSSPTMLDISLPSPVSPSPANAFLAPPPRPAPMERRRSTDLFECVEAHSRFDERTARYIFSQIVEIVYALQQMGICHRDIKDENVVCDAEYRVKLIDFGSAVIFDPRQPAPLYHRFFGTTSFAAAEILRGEAYQAPPAEVWSLGVLLSILLTGECPFADADAAKEGRLSRPRVPLSLEVEHLMRCCLQVDASKRITVSQMRKHPWLASVTGRRATC
ncbi:hypothetical protein JCM10908_006209 [Rhodotorula pacifica]|uniref:uncharacterized protein n=1 Tax=Rhodotorula pacifica TaxID=1495444 RepID=UPI00317CEA0D